MTKHADFDKYKYSGYDIGLMHLEVFCYLMVVEFGKNVIIFGADMSSSVHIDSKKKGILILDKGQADGLIDTRLTAEKECSINFTKQQNKLCLSLNYIGVNNYIYFNGVEIYKFKAKHSEINAAQLLSGNVSKDFSVDSMKETGLYGFFYDFSVDYHSIDVDYILTTHKYLMKKTQYKIMFGFIKNAFIGLLSTCTKASFGESLTSNFDGHINLYL